jgi:hypothetical protein
MPTTKKSSTKVLPVKQSKPKQLPSGREASNDEASLMRITGAATVFSADQVNILSARTPEYAIRKRPGGGGKALSYVPHGYVTATLNKVFGFDWDYVLKPVFNGSLVQQIDVTTAAAKRGDPPRVQHNLTVYGELTVRIHNAKGNVVTTITKGGPGSAIWHEENEYGDAVKSAKSDGLKVAAHELGIALDLYFDEDAAIDEYQQKQNDAATAIEAASMPSNPFELLARAQSDYKLDGQTLCAKLQIDMPVLLAVTDPETIRGYWRTLGGNNAKPEVIN